MPSKRRIARGRACPMGPDPHSAETNSKHKPHKLPRLPQNSHVSKRPLLHAPIASPYTNASRPKVVYISASTPFISAVKRVRKLLAQIEKRAVGPINLVNGPGSDKQKIAQLREQVEKASVKKGKEKEEVLLKGTGRAIQRVLELGLFFQEQDDLDVMVRTGTVGAVDDVVRDEETGGEGEMRGVESGEKEMPEARVRMMSFVEIGVARK